SPSMVTRRRWRASMAGWICGKIFDDAKARSRWWRAHRRHALARDSMGIEAAGVHRVPGSSIAIDGRRLRFCRDLTRRRPRDGHVAHLRQMDSQFLDDHAVHDAAARFHPLDNMVAVPPHVRLV